ncbi:MAG: hypothetical protein HYX54_07340 [Chloroflexi bacterium]|nr:hypothetical protein [Chloroflexota bacterium]
MTRTADDVGFGLAPARPPRPIRVGERIHVVGAAGAGASAAALLAIGAGAAVDGCDVCPESPYTQALEVAGIHVAAGHGARHVRSESRPERLAVSKALTAIAPHHDELEAARELGIVLEPWQQLVADAAVGRRLVAVAGTHGKSTSAGWLVHVLAAAGEDPAAFVGALLPASLTGGVPATARLGRGEAFVVEADEYAGNFDPFGPSIAVLTSAEWDHPDVFADRGAVLDAFEAWLRRARPGPDGNQPTLVANVGDPGVAEIASRLQDWEGRIVAVALADAVVRNGLDLAGNLAARYRTAQGPAATLIGRIMAASADGTTLDLDWSPAFRTPGATKAGAVPPVVRLPTAGRHNATNALGVAGAALALGLRGGAIGTGLASFAGVGRRLERKGERHGVVVYDDYGHHPTAIRATIAAMRQLEPGRRLWVACEPLTYHRTAALLDALAAALATADAVAISDIWAGRDLDTTVVTSADVAAATARLRPEMTVVAPGSVEATADWLAGEIRSGEAVLVMGGGRSYRIAERLLEPLAENE